jgi:hypothetical protein
MVNIFLNKWNSFPRKILFRSMAVGSCFRCQDDNWLHIGCLPCILNILAKWLLQLYPLGEKNTKNIIESFNRQK